MIAAAGCGKTELIANAVRSDDRRHLILTHTNAGVAALRTRLRAKGVPPRRARVETITGFCLRFAAAYPMTSGVTTAKPSGNEWADVVAGASTILRSASGGEVLRASYGSVFVDEYQDCDVVQHALVCRIAELVPTRLVGDPLQGIFAFKNQQLVEWESVDADFERLPDLNKPWRWANSNPELGAWLIALRDDLLAGRPPDFSAPPVRTGSTDVQSQVAACARLLGETSVVAIRQWPDDAHRAARRLGGHYTSMDEVEGKDLRRHCARLDEAHGTDFALAVLNLADACMIGISDHVRTARSRLTSGALPVARAGSTNAVAVAALRGAAESASPSTALAALSALEELPDARVCRKELLGDARTVLRTAEASGELLEDLAWAVRDRTRRFGRTVERRVVSRTLLVKGLEFDHAIILDASDWLPPRQPTDLKNLYVAVTRPRCSLTVLHN